MRIVRLLGCAVLAGAVAASAASAQEPGRQGRGGRAQGGVTPSYQGLGRFWNLPLEQLMKATLYGIRLIADPVPPDPCDDINKPTRSCCQDEDPAHAAGACLLAAAGATPVREAAAHSLARAGARPRV